MVFYRKNVTGITHTVFISPRGKAQHGPRIKVAINPPNSISPLGQVATVTFDCSVVGKIDPELAQQVIRFIEINRAVLLEYWNYEIYTDELQQRLQSI
jgi:hypothetical protein